MKLERINTAKGFCAKRSQRISELHRNNACEIGINFSVTVIAVMLRPRSKYQNACVKH